MANNPDRGGNNNANNNNMNEHVEFTVRAEEDLYLTGSENTLRRVTADTNYSCLMLKTQRFSSLFRHYAKYHGLRKDDLEYYFVNPLENEDTPETVHLQRGDIIMVRKKRKAEVPEPSADDGEFFKDMKELLDDEEHMDTVFLVHPYITPAAAKAVSAKHGIKKSESTAASSSAQPSQKKQKVAPDTVQSNTNNDRSSSPTDEMETDDSALIEIRAHKSILTARAEYFKALFRKSAGESSTGHKVSTFKESTECIIRVEPHFTPKIIRLMLEFMYTNRIECLKSSSRLSSVGVDTSPATISTDELLSLLHLSDMWQLRDLKRLVEHELIRSHTTIDTVARMYCATEDYNARRLAKSCLEFIMENYREVTGSVSFQEEMKNYPHLCIPVLKAAADLIPEHPSHKKQRLSEGNKEGVGGGGGVGSSPVVDSDH
ncbi:hypothetical protein ACHAWO_011343 [Cyclotella atomus]|uniref:BTB domain-containing protein n=1 Tax=Cyclotella atomus TaxID=382360 RepID=A0ABD3Q9U3_9STRA